MYLIIIQHYRQKKKKRNGNETVARPQPNTADSWGASSAYNWWPLCALLRRRCRRCTFLLRRRCINGHGGRLPAVHHRIAASAHSSKNDAAVAGQDAHLHEVGVRQRGERGHGIEPGHTEGRRVPRKRAGAAVEVINFGKNSLPVFTHFEKRMCRVEGQPDKLYGYNEGQTRPFVGPGYFVAHDFPERGEVGIDYRMVPPDDAQLPDGWPAIKPNEKGVQMFVYKGMVDYMRKVSQTVTIGRAYKGGEKDLGHTFLLCRH